MCQSCLPAATRLAQNVLSNINFDIGGLHTLEPPSVSAQSAGTSHEIHVFTGGSIVTMKHGDPHRVESLATLDDKILAAGSTSYVKEQVDKHVQEDPSICVYPEPLDGDCLFPGFIEPHCHLLLSALIGHFFVNLDPLALKSNKRSDALSVLKNATPKGGWIAGYGYDPARMEDHADLSMTVLDGVSGTIPIFVINASGHIGYANSPAFSIAGITKTTPNPTGGAFVKDRHGNLTGVLLEVPAMAPFEAHLEPPLPQDFVKFAYGTLKKWSEAGCTTVFDAGIGLIRPGTDVDIRLLDAVTSQFPPVVRYTGHSLQQRRSRSALAYRRTQ
jgi:predicted amidohydrolase YtcJ